MERVVKSLIHHHVLDEEDYDLYLYGFQQLLFIFCHLSAYMIIACLYHELWSLFVFLAFFIPLRSYAGGYHAKTQLACYFVSVATVFGVLTALKYGVISTTSHIVLAVVSYAVITVLAPRASKNKPFVNDDSEVYRRKSLRILNIGAVFAIVGLWLGFGKLFACMSLALFLSAALLMIDLTMAMLQD